MACGRSVVGTTVGGPPEFVPAEAGILVDPLDELAIAAALREAAQLPRPNPAARAAAERHDVNEQARRVEEILRGSNPNHHKPTDLPESYSDADYRFGFNIVKLTMGAVADLAGAHGP